MLTYIGNELKPKERDKYITDIREVEEGLHQQVKDILDGTLYGSTSILKANETCDILQRNLQNLYNAQNSKTKYDFGVATFKVDICKMDSIYKFVLGIRLPHVPRIDIKSSKSVNKTANDVFSTCFCAMLEYYTNNPFEMYEKVFVVFINFYEENEFWTDVDNINYKSFIDACVKNFFVKDDNSRYVSMASISKEGYPHTEVYVGRDITDILEYLF